MLLFNLLDCLVLCLVVDILNELLKISVLWEFYFYGNVIVFDVWFINLFNLLKFRILKFEDGNFEDDYMI